MPCEPTEEFRIVQRCVDGEIWDYTQQKHICDGQIVWKDIKAINTHVECS